MAWATYADVADYGEWKFGRRTTGLVFSAAQFAQKFGLTIGAGLVTCLVWICCQGRADGHFPAGYPHHVHHNTGMLCGDECLSPCFLQFKRHAGSRDRDRTRGKESPNPVIRLRANMTRYYSGNHGQSEGFLLDQRGYAAESP
jgi:hypothetical protein